MGEAVTVWDAAFYGVFVGWIVGMVTAALLQVARDMRRIRYVPPPKPDYPPGYPEHLRRRKPNTLIEPSSPPASPPPDPPHGITDAQVDRIVRAVREREGEAG